MFPGSSRTITKITIETANERGEERDESLATKRCMGSEV